MENVSSINDRRNTISSTLLAGFREFIEDHLGLHFSPSQDSDLSRKIDAITQEFGFTEAESCLRWLLSFPLSREHIDTLATCLTVEETYFFRDKHLFNVLETYILPKIIQARKGRGNSISLWSAGCSSGEEPYSLAIVLSRLLPELKDWHVRIFATDISPVSLNKAKEGRYGEWSFRHTPSWLKEMYFHHVDNNYQIVDHIRDMVSFSRMNLVSHDSFSSFTQRIGSMDVIFCRNVLMYFTREKAGMVLDNLTRCLVEGGYLVTSPVELSGFSPPRGLHSIHFRGATLWQKRKTAENEAVTVPANTTRLKKKFSPVTRKEDSRQIDKFPTPVPVPVAVSDSARIKGLADAGKLGEALAVCEQVILTDKLDPGLHYLQAIILQEMDREDEAVQALRRALYVDQDFVMAHFVLGHLLHRKGQSQEAEKHFENVGSLLQSYDRRDIIPASDGMNVGKMIELIDKVTNPGEKDNG